MVYFPNGKVLTQPDIYMPNDKRNIIDGEPYGHAPWLQNFMANIMFRKLDVAWHAPIHGDYVPHSQFLDALVFMTQFVPPRSSTNETETQKSKVKGQRSKVKSSRDSI
jgi:hypothetical protein